MADQNPKTLLLDLCPEPRLPQTSYLRRAFAVDKRFEVHTVTDLKAAIAKAQKAESVLIYFEVSKKEHIVNLIILLSAVTSLSQRGLCRSIGFMLIPKGAEQIEAMLKQKGVSEVVPARTSEKGVLHKLNRFYEGIQSAVSRNRRTDTTVKVTSGAPSVEMIDPLKVVSDYWILQRMGDIKFRRETWMLNMIGPPPSFGKWELDRTLKTNGMDGWIWVPRRAAPNAKDEGSGAIANGVLRAAMDQDQGRWVFWGNPPQFSTQTCMWLFVSRSPRLAWYPKVDPKSPLLKLAMEGSKLKITKNPENTAKIVGEIQAILTADVRFKSKSRPRGQDLEIAVERPRRNGGSFSADFPNPNDQSLEFDPNAAGGEVSPDFGAPDFNVDFSGSDSGISLDVSEEAGPSGEGDIDIPLPDANFTGEDFNAAEEPGRTGDIDFGAQLPEESLQVEDEGFFKEAQGEEESGFSFGKAGRKSRSSGGVAEALDPRAPAEVPAIHPEPRSQNGFDPAAPSGQLLDFPSEPAPGAGPEPYEALFKELGFGITITPLVAVAGETQSYPVKFLDLFENQLSLEVVGLKIRKGQLFTVRFEVANSQPPLDFSTRSKVMEIETSDGAVMTIGLEIEPVDPALIERFLAVFQERQQHVTEFLIAAKGGR